MALGNSNLIITIKAEDMASNVIKSVSGSINSLANDITRVAFTHIADGIENATLALGKFQMELELTDIAFTQMIKGADRGRSSLEEYTQVARALRNELHDLAAETPFSFQDVNRGARQLMAYGFGVKEIEPMLRTIGDAAAAFGGSPVAIYRTIRALGQIKAYGRLKGQELLQLTEVGIPAHEILREELKLSSEQLSRIADQHIPAQEAIDAILRGIEKRYAGMMEVQSKTMQGSIAAIKDNLMLVGTQLTRSLYDEIRDSVRAFRLSLDEYKDVTRASGWRGLFGQQRFYDREGKEIDVSQMSDEELKRRIHRDEITRVFSRDRYYNKEGKLFDTTGKSQQELDSMVRAGELEKRGPLIPMEWQESIFIIGDAFLELAQSAKQLGSAIGGLWNTMFGGTHGLSDVGSFIFRMINGFIVLTTWIVKGTDAIGKFIGEVFEVYTGGKLLQGILMGIAGALAMTFAMNTLQNVLLFLNTFKMMFGYAGIVGGQFGLLVSATYLVGQTSSQAAVGVAALGSTIMLLANRAQIAAAFMLAWAGVMRGFRTIITPIVAIFTAIRTVVGPAIAAFTLFRSATTALTASLLALRGAYGFTRLGAIAVTAAVAAGTTVVIAARAAYGVFYATLLAIRTAYAVATGAAASFHITLVAGMALQRTWVSICAIAQGAITALSIAVNGFTTVLTVCRTALAAFTALGAGPALAVILALSVIFYTVYDNWTSIWQALSKGFSAFVDWILSGVSKFSKGAYDTLIKGFEWIGEKVSNLWKNYVKDWLNSLGGFVKSAIDLLKPLADSLFNPQQSLKDRLRDNKIRKVLEKYTDIDPYGKNTLKDVEKNYKVEIPQDTGLGKNKNNTKKLQSWEKEVSLGEYFAYTSTSIDAVGKSFDDMLPSLLQATKSFSDFSGTIEDFQKYALTKPGNGINNSIVYNPNDENFALKRGNIILYTGEDGKLHSALYMGDNKIRMGAEEVTTKWVEEAVNVATSKMSVRDVTIEPQGAGECTIKSAKAFLGYYGQDNSGLTFGNWADRMRDFVGNNGYDVADYSEYERRITNHFAQGGGPVMVYFTGGAGTHELNPSSGRHAFIIAGQDEQGNWIVKDPNGGVTRKFHNLYGTWDESRSPTYDAKTGAVVYLKEGYSSSDIQSNNKLTDWVHSLMPDLSEDIINYTAKTAQEYGVSLAQVFAQMYAESKGDIYAESPAGAIGLMQLLPDTAAGLGVDPYDVYENIRGGIEYIKNLLVEFPDIASAIAAYNAGPGAVARAGGVPDYAETKNYVQEVMSKMETFPSDIANIGESTAKVLRQTSEFAASSIKSIENSMAFIIDADAFNEKKIIEDAVSKERAKALNAQYKEYEKINKAAEDYQKYMFASKLQLDELDGTLTDYRKKVLEVNTEYHNSITQAEKLLGQGLSRDYVEKMKTRAKEVAEAVLKEFERVKDIEINIEYKSNQAKIAELNNDIDKALGLQYESDVLQWENYARESAKKMLIDASPVQGLLEQYREVSKTPSRQGISFKDFIQEALSVNEPFSSNNPLATFVETNKAYLDQWVAYVDAKRQEIDNNLTLSAKTLYSKTVESFANQGNLQGFLDYRQSEAGQRAFITESEYQTNKMWIEMLKADFQSLGERIANVMRTAHDSIIENGTNALMDMIKGTKSAKEAFKEFALSVLEDMARIAIKSALSNAIGNIFSGLKIFGFAQGGHVTKGETILVGEQGPELLSVTKNKSALDNSHTQVVGTHGPEFMTVPYSGYIISNDDVHKMLGYYSDDKSIGYVINGFRAKGGDVKKGEAYIVGEKGPEVFSPGQSGSIMSNNQLNSTLNNLERITNSGTMSSKSEGEPTSVTPPVVVNLENKSGQQMDAEATSNFDGEKWVINVVMDAVRRNVGGMRDVMGNLGSRR